MSDATSWLMCGNVKSKNHVRTCSVFAKCKTPKLYKVTHQKIEIKVKYIRRRTSRKEFNQTYTVTHQNVLINLFLAWSWSHVFLFLFFILFLMNLFFWGHVFLLFSLIFLKCCKTDINFWHVVNELFVCSIYMITVLNDAILHWH